MIISLSGSEESPKPVRANSEEEFTQLKAAYEARGCFTSFTLSLMVWAPMAWLAGWF